MPCHITSKKRSGASFKFSCSLVGAFIRGAFKRRGIIIIRRRWKEVGVEMNEVILWGYASKDYSYIIYRKSLAIECFMFGIYQFM